jgi:hypothetical protein
MNRFLVLYVGPATPPDASHEGWPEWFAKLGDRLSTGDRRSSKGVRFTVMGRPMTPRLS